MVAACETDRSPDMEGGGTQDVPITHDDIAQLPKPAELTVLRVLPGPAGNEVGFEEECAAVAR